MPGPITYAAVTLLARDRLGQIRRALDAKKAAGTAQELELHVLQLASEAERMMGAIQPVIEAPVRLYGPPLTVSRFTLLGSVGPDLPRYAAYFAPGQRWLYDTLHKGTPDEHREKVLANTTNLVFDFWKRVGPLVDREFSLQKKRDAAKDKMRAYVLGHVCHLATDVLTHPYFEAIEARLAIPAAPPAPAVSFMTRDDVAGAFDVRVSDTFFGRGTDTRTKKWADWFPTPREVPKSFAAAMVASIESLYGARAEGLPAFEEVFAAIKPEPPRLNKGLIEEAIDSFHTIIGIERVWTLGDWLGTTAAMFLPLALAYFGALVLPLGKNLSRELTPEEGEAARKDRLYESVVFPLAASALGPLVTMIIVSATGRGLRAEGITGWVHAGYSLIASVGFFASLGGSGGARWALWYCLPLALAAAQIAFVLSRGARENSRTLLWLGPLVQIALALLFMVLYRGWLHEGVEELQKDAGERNNLKAFGDFFAWLAIVVVLWLVHAILWRYVFSASVPDDKDAFSSGEPRQLLRLYDDVALIHDAKAPLSSEQLADLVYPPARRPLLELWWEAGTAPSVKLGFVVDAGLPGERVVHDRLVFHWDAPAGTADQTVFAPVAPMTVDAFGQLLAAAVTGDAVKGTLHVKAVRDDEKALELAPGAVFADHGDGETDLAAHDAAAILFKEIGTSEATAFTLSHASRPRLAERMGRSGVAPDGRRSEQAGAAGSVLTAAVDGAGAVIPRRYQASNDGAGQSPLLRKLLRPGDVLEIASAVPAMGEQRIVERVLSETDVVVSSAFTALPAAGLGYKRAALDRGAPAAAPITLQTLTPQVSLGTNDVRGVGATPFGAFLMVGDVISVATVPPQRRRVTAVKDFVTIGTPPVAANLLELDAVLAPAATAAVAFTRLGDAEADGFAFVANVDDVFGEGEGVMNDAADLATLLCLSAASRLAPNDTPVAPTGATTAPHRVYQVFRNWNLDRRRVNEWKLLVSGGAVSERRGGFRAADEAAPMAPGDDYATASADLIAKRQEGERTVRELGVLPVFRSWIEMAGRPRNDVTAREVFRPGLPTNRDLSRAVAYLLDAQEAATP